MNGEIINSKKRAGCGHAMLAEGRNESLKVRILEGARPSDRFDLSELIERRINLESAPYEISTISPTPFDPYHLTVHGGMEYESDAVFYMNGSAHETEPRETEKWAATVLGEIGTQHALRMDQNDDSFQRLKEIVAEKPGGYTLDAQRAEGFMQVRAGIARCGTMLAFLDAFPGIKALEISKATRPYCPRRFSLALAYTARQLNSLTEGTEFSVERINNGVHKTIAGDDKNVVVAKHVVAEIKGRNTTMEAVRRDSFIKVDPDEPYYELMEGELGSEKVGLIPIDATTYARVKSVDR